MRLENLKAEKDAAVARNEKLKEKENTLKAKQSLLPDMQRKIDAITVEMQANKKDIDEAEQRYQEKIKEIGLSNQMLAHMFEMFEIRDGTSEDSKLDVSVASVPSNDLVFNSTLESSFNMASVSMDNLLRCDDNLTYTKSSSKDSHNNTMVVIDQNKVVEDLNEHVFTGNETEEQLMNMVYSLDGLISANEAVSKTSIAGDVFNGLFNFDKNEEKNVSHRKKAIEIEQPGDQVIEEIIDITNNDEGGNEAKKRGNRRRSSKPKQ